MMAISHYREFVMLEKADVCGRYCFASTYTYFHHGNHHPLRLAT
jgi:hypothetical protein